MEMKYFVLKPKGGDIHAQASRDALRAYAKAIASSDPTLAMDLNAWADLERLEATGVQ